MKKLLLITLTLFGLNSFAQSFPGNKPEILLNKVMKPIEKDEILQFYGYKNFIDNFDTITKEYKITDLNNKPFYNEKCFCSRYEDLKKLKFKVKKIFNVNDKYSIHSDKSMLQLENDSVGIVYYLYDPKYEHSFELELDKGEILPNEVFCEDIDMEKDKFNGEVTYRTPFGNQGINLTKIKKNNVTNYYLSVSVDGSTLNVGTKGAYVLFDNGKKISRPNESIDVDSNIGTYSSGWEYSAFIKLNQEDIKLLKNNKITDVKLYIYQNEVSKNTSIKIQQYMKCLTK